MAKGELTMNKEKCPYCSFDRYHDDPNEFIIDEGLLVSIRKNNTLEISFWGDYDELSLERHAEINYCPKCGRNLRNESNR